MSKFFDGLEKYIYWTSIPKIGLNDIVDILIVSVMIYLIVKWIKTTRAWVLLKGIIILLCIAFAAYLLQLHTVSWILSNTMGVGITAILIVFQPELRSALHIKIADLFGLAADIPVQGTPAGQIHGAEHQCLIHGQIEAAVALDTAHIAQRPCKGLTQRNAHILGGVVVVHLHIAVAGEH